MRVRRCAVLAVALLAVACSSRLDQIQEEELERVTVDDRFQLVDEGLNGTMVFRDYVGPAAVPAPDAFEVPSEYRPWEARPDDPELLASWIRELSPDDTCLLNVRTSPRTAGPEEAIYRLVVACQVADP